MLFAFGGFVVWKEVMWAIERKSQLGCDNAMDIDAQVVSSITLLGAWRVTVTVL
jgi:hypothetical protein